MHGYVLIVGNHIERLPLNNLRVIRGKSLLDVQVPAYATSGPPTTTPRSLSDYDNDVGGVETNFWNVTTKVYNEVETEEEDSRWKNGSVTENTPADSWTTTVSDSQDDERVLCSLFVGSNVKINSTSIGLKEIHLTSLHGQ